MMTQAARYETFKALHRRGDPVILYNIWDAGGAQALADAGAKAIATGSWAVAAVHGFEDGEAIPLDLVMTIVERISRTVDLPLTVDFEGGYAEEITDLQLNVRRVIDAGAIGINFEDRIVRGEGLYPISAQTGRLKSVRQAAVAANALLFLNARTDVFLANDASVHRALVEEAIERGRAYREAGADGFFIPGLTDKTAIGRIVDAVNLPINVMMMGDIGSVVDAAKYGVSRASYGPGSYLAAMQDLARRFTALG